MEDDNDNDDDDNLGKWRGRLEYLRRGDPFDQKKKTPEGNNTKSGYSDSSISGYRDRDQDWFREEQSEQEGAGVPLGQRGVR